MLTSLKEFQKVNNSLAPGSSTIVTFDLQLYSKNIQLQLNSDLDDSFVIRLGELHVVFTTFKCLGKLINGSRLNQAFKEALLYGSTTVEQIKNGHHLYKYFEGHRMLYLALFKEYISTMVAANPSIEKELRDAIIAEITIAKEKRETKASLIISHAKILQILNSFDFLKYQKQFHNELKNQAKFLKNFMALFETLIMFIRARRQQDWELHLASLHCLCKYFFTFDMINYARLRPAYLTKMFSLKEKDPDTWQMFHQGNFSVNKTSIPFFAIGVDHVIEQENRAVKVLGLDTRHCK